MNTVNNNIQTCDDMKLPYWVLMLLSIMAAVVSAAISIIEPDRWMVSPNPDGFFCPFDPRWPIASSFIFVSILFIRGARSGRAAKAFAFAGIAILVVSAVFAKGIYFGPGSKNLWAPSNEDSINAINSETSEVMRQECIQLIEDMRHRRRESVGPRGNTKGDDLFLRATTDFFSIWMIYAIVYVPLAVWRHFLTRRNIKVHEA